MSTVLMHRQEKWFTTLMLTMVPTVSLGAINLHNNLPMLNILILFLDGVVKVKCQKWWMEAIFWHKPWSLFWWQVLFFIMTTLSLVLFLCNSHLEAPRNTGWVAGESESRSRFPALSIFKWDMSPKLCPLFENDLAFLAPVGFLKMTWLFETPAKMQKNWHFETT